MFSSSMDFVKVNSTGVVTMDIPPFCAKFDRLIKPILADDGRRRDWKQIAFWVLSLLVALSMVLGYIIAVISPNR
jgi:hypothetical protein